jgi:hypothetical protein
MFEAVAAPMAQSVDMDAAAQANPQPGPESVLQSVIFHAATGLDESAITTVQANVRKRILRAFVARGHTEPLQFDKYSGELVLTPLELINRIAQLVPPPRTGHRCGMSGAQESQEQGEGVEGVEAEPDWPDSDLDNQSQPDYPDDQRTDW